MLIELFKGFSKKVNSTKRPSNGISKNVKLKDNCSKENPVFILNDIDFDYNYAKWGDHYYFIDDMVVMSNNHMEISCRQDLLATFKDYIGNYNAFVERSASNYDTFINDNAITQKQAIIQSSHETIKFTDFSNTGCYMLRVVGSNTTASSTGITTFAVSGETLTNVISFMFTQTGEIGEVITDEFVKAVFNPFEYIVDVRWCPFPVEVVAGDEISIAPIKIGWFNTGHNGYVVKTLGKEIDYSIAVPKCYYGNNDFRRYNPNFTEFKLFIMGVGCIKIPPIDVTANGLKIRYAIDWDSGNATVSVRRSDGVHIISEHTFQFLVPIKIAQVNSSVDNIIGAASSIAGGIITGGVSGLISSAMGGINGLSKVMTEGTSGNGSFGNRVAYITYPYITLFQTAYDSAEFPTAVAGRPLYKNVNINTLNGYVQCANASIDIPALGNDRDAVNSFLNNGFYYE